MCIGRVGRLLAGALLALIVAAPMAARAQEQVVVPIPPSFNDHPPIPQDDARSQQSGTPAVTVPVPEAAATEPKAAAAAPPPPQDERSARQDGPLPLPAPPATSTPEPKAAATELVPPLNDQRTVRHEDVPSPPAVNAPERKAAATEPPPASKPAAAAPKATDDDIKIATDQPLGGADAPIADKLREIVTGKRFGNHIARAPDRHAIEAFYVARNYAPLWIHDGRLTARATTAIVRLKDAAADGLDASAYPVPRIDASSDPAALASGDIELTSSLLTFARHLAVGRIAPSRVFEQVDYGDHTPQPADVLKTIADAGDVVVALDSFNPPHEGFRALKRELAALRAHAGETHERIPDGRAIRPGHKDARVPMLHARFGLKGKRHDTTYDSALVEAIQALQRRHDLRPSGIIDRKTLAAINEPKAGEVIDRVLANMERWRWLPRDLGSTYVMVNVPDYTLKVVHRQRVVWRTKIIAGKPQTPTPLATATMDSVIVNPSWHVPQSIIENELLPRYQTDPNIFDRMGLELKRGRDGNISVVQPPGAANALGRIKFNFPNKFQVYLHDTPQKRLFKYGRRAFSHGCMRVEDPTKLGELVLNFAMKRQSPNAHEIQSMFGSDKRVFRLAEKPQVHLTYQTAFVDDAGKLQLRDDIYGFDGRIEDILHGRQPRVAAVAPPSASKRNTRTIRHSRTEATNGEPPRPIERQEAYNPSFNPLRIFENIFR